jgi:hypothetical protein
MKKLIYTAILFLGSFQFINAQCVPGIYSGNHGYILPDSTQFPHAQLNQPFSSTIQIQVAHDTTGTFVVGGIPVPGTFVFDSVTIHGVNTVPALPIGSIQYTCSTAGCKFLGASTGCINVSVPASGTGIAATYRINVTAVGKGVFTPTLLPIPSQQSITQLVNWYKLIVDGTGAGIVLPDNFDESAFSLIDVKPNPANDEFSFNYFSPKNSFVQFTMTDLVGKTVVSSQLNATKGINNFVLDVNHYANGIYFISFITDGKKISKKVSIQHH